MLHLSVLRTYVLYTPLLATLSVALFASVQRVYEFRIRRWICLVILHITKCSFLMQELQFTGITVVKKRELLEVLKFSLSVIMLPGSQDWAPSVLLSRHVMCICVCVLYGYFGICGYNVGGGFYFSIYLVSIYLWPVCYEL